MDKVLLIAGPSAVGKTTVMDDILARDKRFSPSRSATTRQPRGDGRDSEYVYLTREEFISRIESGDILEYTEYAGNLYGTPRAEIERILDEGKYPVLVLDLCGIESFKRRSAEYKSVACYITAPLDVLDARLRDRAAMDANNEKAILTMKKRQDQNRRDLDCFSSVAHLFDLVVENIRVEDTSNAILDFFINA